MRNRSTRTSADAFMFPAMLERQFSVRTLAELWALSPDTVQRLFEDEPEVFKMKTDGSKRQGSGTLRIPESVARRVWERMAR